MTIIIVAYWHQLKCLYQCIPTFYFLFLCRWRLLFWWPSFLPSCPLTLVVQKPTLSDSRFLCSVGSSCVRGRGRRRCSTRGGLWVKTSGSSTWMTTAFSSGTRRLCPKNTGSPFGPRLTETFCICRTGLNRSRPHHCCQVKTLSPVHSQVRGRGVSLHSSWLIVSDLKLRNRKCFNLKGYDTKRTKHGSR